MGRAKKDAVCQRHQGVKGEKSSGRNGTTKKKRDANGIRVRREILARSDA